MAVSIYLLCALTSAVCALLLARAFVQRRVRLLLWTCACFVGLALNNLLVFIDLIIVPEIDLSLPRALVALCGLLPLVFGLVWES
jgi:hypothetical protein